MAVRFTLSDVRILKLARTGDYTQNGGPASRLRAADELLGSNSTCLVSRLTGEVDPLVREPRLPGTRIVSKV
jgi:hypothetical protein